MLQTSLSYSGKRYRVKERRKEREIENGKTDLTATKRNLNISREEAIYKEIESCKI